MAILWKCTIPVWCDFYDIILFRGLFEETGIILLGLPSDFKLYLESCIPVPLKQVHIMAHWVHKQYLKFVKSYCCLTASHQIQNAIIKNEKGKLDNNPIIISNMFVHWHVLSTISTKIWNFLKEFSLLVRKSMGDILATICCCFRSNQRCWTHYINMQSFSMSVETILVLLNTCTSTVCWWVHPLLFLYNKFCF